MPGTRRYFFFFSATFMHRVAAQNSFTRGVSSDRLSYRSLLACKFTRALIHSLCKQTSIVFNAQKNDALSLNDTFRNFFPSRNRNFLVRKTIEQIEIIKGGSEIMKFFFYRDAWIEQSGN